MKSSIEIETNKISAIIVRKIPVILRTKNNTCIAILHLVDGTRKSVLDLETANKLALISIFNCATYLSPTAGIREDLDNEKYKQNTYSNGKQNANFHNVDGA